MTRQIGTVFTYQGNTYKVIESQNGARCNGCDLLEVCYTNSWDKIFAIVGYCNGFYRSDHKSVIMKKL